MHTESEMKVMFSIGAVRPWSIALLVLAVAACNDRLPVTPIVTPAATVSVRIVNAAPGIQNVSVFRDGVTTAIAQNLNYGSFTQSCVSLPVGTPHTLTFRAGTTDLASVVLDPVPSGKYSVFL